MRGTVVTLGGGGFLMSEDGSSAIDDYILGLTEKRMPRVCFVPTASGDSAVGIERFLAAFEGRAHLDVYSVFGRSPWGMGRSEQLLDADVIYVGGGSTANMLALWRLHGTDGVLREAVSHGVILAGISAGMNCWFDGSSTDSFGELAPLADGLGLLAGSACPHYRGEPGRREKYLRWVAGGSLTPGYAVDDYAALVFRDGVQVDAVAERVGAEAFFVEPADGSAVERAIDVRVL